MIESSFQLGRMKKCFPSWTDIRKRTNKSNGGAMLHAYAKEADIIQKEIEQYQNEFFLWYYDTNGLHETIPAYLYVSLIGDRSILDISIEGYTLTDNTSDFYGNRKTHILYQDSCLIMHKELVDLLGEDKYITYQVTDGDNTYTYKAKMYYRHVWNIFDEFAKFSGLTRYNGETNRELSNRVWQHYINFPNASETGLKNAIINGIYNFFSAEDIIGYEDIKIEAPTVENLALSDDGYDDIYDHITKYNKDQFRVKKWDTSLWEHAFKKSELIAHPWDKEPERYQDGVGFGDDLKTDYVDNLDVEDCTDLEVYGYVKDRKQLIKYLHDNNIETEIKLNLLKYKDTLNPIKLQYRINASPATLINPNSFSVISKQKKTGNKTYNIQDIIESSENITPITNNVLNGGKKYRFVFSPKEDFSSMSIYNFDISKVVKGSDNVTSENMLRNNSNFEYNNGVFENKNVLAHAVSTSDFNDTKNIEDGAYGMIVSSAAQEGILLYNVTGMSGKTVFVKSTCPEVNIIENTNVVTISGDFKKDKYGNYIYAEEGVFTGESTINISLEKCRSFSFDFIEDDSTGGSIRVRIITDKEDNETTYFRTQHISQEFNVPTSVQVLIKRNSFHQCKIENLTAARYDIVPSINHGEVKIDSYTGKMKISGFNNTSDPTYLTLTVKCYSSSSPIIEYVHIGDSLRYTNYTVDYDATNTGYEYYVSLKTECQVRLYIVNANGSTTLLNNNYDPATSYKNASTKKGYICLKLDDFKTIKSSDPAIRHRYSGRDISYIELDPGDEIKSISINGIYLKTLQSKKLSRLLFKDGDPGDNDVYVSRAINSFVISDNNNHTYLKDITYASLPAKTDICCIQKNDHNVVVAFVLAEAENTIYIGPEIDKKFEKLCIHPNENTEHIAYNEIFMYSNVKNNIQLTNTFSPILSFYKRFVYVLDSISSSSGKEASISFIHEDGKEYNWSLGANNMLRAKTEFDFNNFDSYDLTIKNIYNKYIVSNDIPLEKRYIIGEEDYELMEFIITPPEDIQFTYKTEKYRELIVVSDTNFNKLKYSNIKISSIVMQGSRTPLTENVDFAYPSDESINKGLSGIIVWLKNSYAGSIVEIEYDIQRPVSMYYSNENALYKIVKFEVDAYKQLDDVNKYQELYDKDVVVPQFSREPDKIVTITSNPKFETIVDDDAIKIVRLDTDDKLAVHNGYVYDEGTEYYFFCDKHVDDVHSINNVELINVVRFHDRLECNIASVNHIPWSNMETAVTRALCNINFLDKKFSKISDFHSLTACESFSNWHSYNADISICKGLNGYGTYFVPQTKLLSQSYSLIDITPYVKKGKIISLYKDKNLNVFIVKETLMDNLAFAKSICISKDNITKFESMKYQGFSYHIIDYDAKQFTRYYLMVTGKGILDDITITDYTTLDDSYNTHKKNLDNLNFKISEKNPVEKLIYLPFTNIGLSMEDAEYSGLNKTLSISTNVFYGLTLVEDINLNKSRKYYCTETQDNIISTDEKAYIVTPHVYLSMRDAIDRLYIKINDIDMDSFGPFNVKVYTSSKEDGSVTIASIQENTNIVEIPGKYLQNYVYAEISMPQGKVIHSVEVYARYAEKYQANLPVHYNQDGYVYTKIYDIGEDKTFKLSDIRYELEGKPENVSYAIRGFRKDKNNIVHTSWYDYSEDEAIKENASHVFEDYSLIQFRIKIKNSDTRLKINEFILEEVNKQ